MTRVTTGMFTIAAVAALAASSAAAAPVQWGTAVGGNGNWYEIVSAGSAIKWNKSQRRATQRTHAGVSGYLATITSVAEQRFLNMLNETFASAIPGFSGQYVTAWLGGTDSATEGDWTWGTGEAFTFTNWAAGEPDNLGNEDYLAGWWSAESWNDCSNTCGDLVSHYVVEYDAPLAPVPLPAGLPLLAAGLGVFTLIGKRKRA